MIVIIIGWRFVMAIMQLLIYLDKDYVDQNLPALLFQVEKPCSYIFKQKYIAGGGFKIRITIDHLATAFTGNLIRN